MEEPKKKREGVVERSGEAVCEVAKKGADVINRFGQGVMKGFRKKDAGKEEEDSDR